MNTKKISYLVVGASLISILGIHLLGRMGLFEGKMTGSFGMINNRLNSCEGMQACFVSRPPESGSQYLHSILTKEPWETAKPNLVKEMNSLGCRPPVEDLHQYLRFECVSSFFRTVDDIEFFFSDMEGRVHVRTKARIPSLDKGRQLGRIRELRNLVGRPDDPAVGSHF